MVICLERGADLHMAQLMPLPLTVSCFSKIQIVFTFLVRAHPGGPGQRAVKRVCVSATTSRNISYRAMKQLMRLKHRHSQSSKLEASRHRYPLSPLSQNENYVMCIVDEMYIFLFQYFDAVGWAAGRASSL